MSDVGRDKEEKREKMGGLFIASTSHLTSPLIKRGIHDSLIFALLICLTCLSTDSWIHGLEYHLLISHSSFRWVASILTIEKWYSKTTYCPSCPTTRSPFWITMSKFVTWGRRRLSSFPLRLVKKLTFPYFFTPSLIFFWVFNGLLENWNCTTITCNFLATVS